MAFAPTRSGKGVGLVVPTAAGLVRLGGHPRYQGRELAADRRLAPALLALLLFNPTDVRSARYNPLLEVRRGTNEVRDVQNIADILVDPEGGARTPQSLEKTSHSLLVGAILHILYAEEDKTLARVASSCPTRNVRSPPRCGG